MRKQFLLLIACLFMALIVSCCAGPSTDSSQTNTWMENSEMKFEEPGEEIRIRIIAGDQVVDAIGWNQYGGWRIGIRSFDNLRYYYYAHLRQNFPYAEGLEAGSIVTAGDVIGYMGHTGYSATENVNNIDVTHLHWGLELIFSEERREAGYEIWVDVYPLTRFLEKHKQQAEKVEGTREWVRTGKIIDPAVEAAKR